MSRHDHESRPAEVVPPGPSRRAVLRGGAGLATAAVLGGPLMSMLSACGSGAAGKVSSAGDVNLPSYVPISGVKPDLPPTAAGVPAGFYSYPANPVASVSKPPLSGAKFTAIAELFVPPPPSRDKNPVWQAVEKGVGATVDFTMVSSDDYAAKLNTVIAGGDLPDLMLYDGSAPTNLPAFEQAKCADLTPILGGDGVKDYPNLANIPTIFWEQCTDAGKLYRLPIPRGIVGGSGFIHQEMFSAVGVDKTADIKSADDFFDILKQLTRPSENKYALAGNSEGAGYVNTPIYQIFGVPNVWRLDGGKLTYRAETDEYAAAIEYLVKLQKAGVYYPGSIGWTKAKMSDAFNSGKVAMIYDGLPAAYGSTGYLAAKTDPSFQPAPFIPFAADGGKRISWADNIVFGSVMLKQADEKRLREVLQLCNFLAAPFGTKEYLLLNFGVEGTDYTMGAGSNPTLTDQGTLDIGVPWKYVAAPPQVVYDPTAKSNVDLMHDAYSQLVPVALKDPTAGIYSPTYGSTYGEIAGELSDTVTSIIAGRKPLSALQGAVKKWRTSGGDKMRAEFEQGLAAQKKG